MLLALFAGIYVSDCEAATEWYARLLGHEPSFIPNDTEAVWQLAEHRSVSARTAAKAAAAVWRRLRLCAADTCVLIRALPTGTTG